MTPRHFQPAFAALLLMLISLLVWGQASAVEKAAISKSALPSLDEPGVVEAFVDGFATPLMKLNDSPSGTVAIMKDGQLIFAKGYGYQDLEQQKPVNPEHTLFRPGSISKLFTWVAVMQMVEQGKLDLDADVNDYLTTFQIKDTFAQPITMRHIMTHTTGFEDGFLGYLIIDDASRLMPLDESLERYQPARVNPPGAQTAYSNYAAALAGLAVANLSGMSYTDYVQVHIFDVLGMDHSSFEEPLPDHLSEEMAAAYAVENGAYTEMPFELISNLGPAGALSSTATDLMKFAQAILNGGELDGRRILKAKTVQQMLTRNFSHDDRLMGMALGFYETDINGVRLLQHGGTTSWFKSDLGIDQQHGLAFFVSFSGAGGSPIRFAFAQAFYDRFFPQTDERPEPPEDFAGRAGKYAGSYAFWRRNFSTIEKAMDLGATIRVAPAEDDSLVVVMGGKAKQYVEIEKNLFQERDPGLGLVAGISPRYVAFQENQQGEITGFVMDGLPFMSLGKLPLYATANLNLSLVALSLLVFFFVILRRLYQRVAIRKWPAEDQAAMRAAVLAALSNLGVFVFAAITLLAVGDRLIAEIPVLFKLMLLFPILAALAGIYVLYQCSLVWKNGLLASQWARVRYTIVTLSALFMFWFYYYWNILGFQYMS